MKYLQDDALAELTALLTDCPVNNNVRSNSRRIHGRLEAYTMKRAGNDKKYAVQLGHKFNEQQQQWYDDMAAAGAAARAAAAAAASNAKTIGRKRSMSTGEVYSHYKESSRTSYETSSSSSNKKQAISFRDDNDIETKNGSADGDVKRRGRSISLDVQPAYRTGDLVVTPASSSNTSACATTTLNATSTPNSGSTSTSTTGHSTIPNFKAMSWAAARESQHDGVNRKLLTDLILTLNHSFPDYDFAAATANEFTVSSLQTAVTRINERLSELAASGILAQTNSPHHHLASTSSSSTSAPMTPLVSSKSSSGSTWNKLPNTAGMTSGSSSSSIGSSNHHTSLLSNLWTAVDKVITLSQVSAVYSYQPTDENGNDDPFAFLKSSLLKSDDGNGDGMSDLEGSSADCGIGPRIVSSVGDDVRSVHHVHHHHLYNDDSDSDHMDGGAGGGEYAPTTTGQVLWTFNYFFVNKHTKRILLFTCIETMMRSTTGFVTAEEEHDDNSSTPRKAGGDTSLLGRRQHHHPDTIPEHDAVHHDGTLLASTFVSGSTHGSSSSGGHRHRRSASLTSLSSQNDNDDDSDAGFNDNDTTASSAVSVDDFDLDPSHSVSGGIPIGTA